MTPVIYLNSIDYLILAAYVVITIVDGIFGPKEIYYKSLNLNVNISWGVLMILVGGAFLLTAFLAKRRFE